MACYFVQLACNAMLRTFETFSFDHSIPVESMFYSIIICPVAVV